MATHWLRSLGVFGADNFACGFVGVRFEYLLLAIVLTDYVEEVGEAIVVVVRDVGAKESLCDWARGVVGVGRGDELFKDGDCDAAARGVVDFVAYGPENDGGVVSVAPD